MEGPNADKLPFLTQLLPPACTSVPPMHGQLYSALGMAHCLQLQSLQSLYPLFFFQLACVSSGPNPISHLVSDGVTPTQAGPLLNHMKTFQLQGVSAVATQVQLQARMLTTHFRLPVQLPDNTSREAAGGHDFRSWALLWASGE